MRRPRGIGLPLTAAALVFAIAGALLGSERVEEAIERVLSSAGPARLSFDGAARVVDGDTLEVGGRRVRLAGVDAPELAQTCLGGDGRDLACGQQVRAALTAFIGNNVVSCQEVGTDRYARILARCRVRGQDLAAWLVSGGLAAAYAGRSDAALRAAEASARAAGTGLWAGHFERPDAWRRRHGE